ncbi:MAG TPA: efflux RND transporter periplasmic adaptor subunit [Gemmataceae bacterium]|nr:efflux RND transporter periplasmic adaptor subunit [Gemmataceae bacterium]
MGDRDLAVLLQSIRRTAAEVGGLSDAELLQRFVATRDEAAFELLLWRHAGLVFGVCRRVLRDVHDAEDAFQATMLILARRAGRIHKQDALAGWLYKVAYHTSLTLRGKRAQRMAQERRLTADVAAPSSLADAAEDQELQAVLSLEVSRLPERLRSLIVLCYLEGKTVDEAAVQLGCPRGTAASRLARARVRLRLRLTRRGLALAVGLAMLQQAGAARQPAHLISTLLARVLGSSRALAGEPALSQSVVTLANEVLKTMFWQKLRITTILMAVAGVLLAGGGVAVHLRAGSGAEPPDIAAGENPKLSQQDQPVEQPPDNVGVKSVKVSKPQRREYVPHNDYMGRLEALRTVEVRASVGGRLEKINFKPGRKVKKWDVLFEVDPAPYRVALDKAEAAFESAEADKGHRNAQLQRARQRTANMSISPEDYEQLAADAAVAEAKWKIAKANLHQAGANLAATKITATVDGVIGGMNVEPGAFVLEEGGRSVLLATITSVDWIRLSFDMDEASFLRYRRLQHAGEVKGIGSPIAMELMDEKGFARVGTLESFDVRIDPKTGTIRVSATFPNDDRLLLPGMSARVRMPFGKPRPVLQIPLKAPMGQDKGKYWIYVVNKSNTIERRFIKDIFGYDSMKFVDEGLQADDLVVVEELKGISLGDKVKPERISEPGPKSNK